jgi:dihydroorotase-like cyclic amidohydrolase
MTSHVRGLHNGSFTIFSSDHCPFRYDQPHGKPTGIIEHPASMHNETTPDKPGDALNDLVKRKGGAFRFIPNGIPGVETRLSLLYTGGISSGRISVEKFVELTSTNPAKLVSRVVQVWEIHTDQCRSVWTLSAERGSNGESPSISLDLC